jgi:UMF1 family MFS transporter
MLQKNNRTILNAWASYDWANSVYNLTITTAIFPIYYLLVTSSAFGGTEVEFFGFSIKNSVLYSYSVSFSFLLIAMLSPLLSGVADYSGKKKRFMQFFTYLGSLSCIALYFFHGENIEYGIICFILASVGYAGALVFYNAFLPEIATADKFDEVSARGYSLGYIGSVILLIISLITIEKAAWFFDVESYAENLRATTDNLSLEDSMKNALKYYKGIATKISFLCVGIWWILFSQIAFYFLKDTKTNNKAGSKMFTQGFAELGKVWSKAKEMPTLKGFLSSFFFYSMGVQAIMVLAPLFGKEELKMESGKLIATVLLLQIIAIPGAYLFAWISKVKGNKVSILIMLILWVGICFGAYFVETDTQFYVLAGFVGAIMGGIQSLSRSTYSKILPENTKDTASYFSFYDVTEKMAIVIGTATFGFVESLTSMRDSALALSVYFIIGLILLIRTKMPFLKEENKKM